MKPLSFILSLVVSFSASAQMNIPLYNGPIPNSKTSVNQEKSEQQDGITIIRQISIPEMTVFLPDRQKANGMSVIIFPGGGYWVNAHSHEGVDVAKKLNEWGVTAFVVKYRIPSDETMLNREIGPLQDAQRAIKIVRERAKEWSIDPNRVGIMGFSAGGHLASTLGTHFENPLIENDAKTNMRPDFMILVYPVISFRENTAHMGSREQLIGKNPDNEKVMFYSNESQVTAKTPPTFLIHASDDDLVKPDNSIVFYQALIQNKVPAELHIYQSGGHGFGMNNKTTQDQWMERLNNWMKTLFR